MFSLLVALNSITQTYLDSLKKDLSKRGFETILLIASISWVGSPILIIGLLVLGKFQLPTDPYFYLLWFGLTSLTVVRFSIFLIGLSKTHFHGAQAFSILNFVITALYATLILHESITLIQWGAITIAFLGALLFFNWRAVDEKELLHNKGLLLILFSSIFGPLGGILYKSATFHTANYHQFLTGRLVADLVCYSVFLGILFIFWYKKNPLPQITSLVLSSVGAVYMIGWAATNLLDSWLIFKLPISLVTVLGAISIPAGYAIGHFKYKEQIKTRHIIGGFLILFAVILFVFCGASSN